MNETASPSRSKMRPALAVMAVVMGLLTLWRFANPREGTEASGNRVLRQPAPAFQLYDQGGNGVKPRIVNLQAYLNRHTVVLVFYDGQQGPEANEVLLQMREFYPALKREGIVVFGVSTALPQENRNNSTQPFPFRLLSDVAATDRNSVHRVWGTFVPPATLDKPAGTKPAVFVIDRAGLVAWEGKHPMPEAEPDSVVATLLKG